MIVSCNSLKKCFTWNICGYSLCCRGFLRPIFLCGGIFFLFFCCKRAYSFAVSRGRWLALLVLLETIPPPVPPRGALSEDSLTASSSLAVREMFVPSDGRPKCAAPNRKAAKGHSEGVGRTQSRYLGGLCVRLARPIPSPFAKYFVLRNCRSPHPSAKGAKRLFRAISRPACRLWISAPHKQRLAPLGLKSPRPRQARLTGAPVPAKVLKLIRKLLYLFFCSFPVYCVKNRTIDVPIYEKSPHRRLLVVTMHRCALYGAIFVEQLHCNSFSRICQGV